MAAERTNTHSAGNREGVAGSGDVTKISLMILIAVQVFGVAFAAGWAIAGLFELGETVSYVLMGLFSAIGIYLLYNFWQKATDVPDKR